LITAGVAPVDRSTCPISIK